MAARLTAAEAKKLGIDVATGAKVRTTRRVAKGAPYCTVCVKCGEEFRTVAAEDRHLAATHHARYRLVLGH